MQILPTVFWCDLQKYGLHLFFCKRWAPFLPRFLRIVPRYLRILFGFCTDFQGFCPNFQQMKTYGGALAPPEPRLLHRCSIVALESFARVRCWVIPRAHEGTGGTSRAGEDKRKKAQVSVIKPKICGHFLQLHRWLIVARPTTSVLSKILTNVKLPNPKW